MDGWKFKWEHQKRQLLWTWRWPVRPDLGWWLDEMTHTNGWSRIRSWETGAADAALKMKGTARRCRFDEATDGWMDGCNSWWKSKWESLRTVLIWREGGRAFLFLFFFFVWVLEVAEIDRDDQWSGEALWIICRISSKRRLAHPRFGSLMQVIEFYECFGDFVHALFFFFFLIFSIANL